MKPTANQILDAIGQIHLKKEFPDGFSTLEFSETIGCHVASGRMKINALIRGGLAKHAGFRPTIRMDGKPNNVPVYILLDPLDSHSKTH